MPQRARVSEIMTNDVVTVDASTPMSEVRRILTREDFHHLPVVAGKKTANTTQKSMPSKPRSGKP